LGVRRTTPVLNWVSQYKAPLHATLLTIGSEPFVHVDVFGQLHDGLEVSLDDRIVAIWLTEKEWPCCRGRPLGLGLPSKLAAVSRPVKSDRGREKGKERA